jgi:hypothetical protein
MTVKQFLAQAYYIDRQIDDLRRELSRLRELGASAPNTLGAPTRTSSRRDKVGDTAAAITDYTAELDDEVRQLIRTKRRIRDFIRRVPEPVGRIILTKRYLGFERWEKIAVDMNFDMRWVLRLHRRTLEWCGLNLDIPLQE